MLNLKIDLPKELESQLFFLEAATNQTSTFHIKEALIRYLEEFADIRDALEVSNRNEKTYTTDELRKELGLDNV